MNTAELQRRIERALQQVAADTGESPVRITVEALQATVTVLVACGQRRAVETLYRQAVKVGQRVQTTLRCDCVMIA